MPSFLGNYYFVTTIHYNYFCIRGLIDKYDSISHPEFWIRVERSEQYTQQSPFYLPSTSISGYRHFEAVPGLV